MRLERVHDSSFGIRIIAAALSLVLISRCSSIGLENFVCPSTNTTCPKSCRCSDTAQVLCNDAGLGRVPTEDIPRFTRYLSLANNQIMVLGSRTFSNYSKLRRLILDDNSIYVIQADTFNGLSDMEELSLQNNPLQKLASFSFSGLTNIKNIHLGHNKIAEVYPDAFAKSRHLKTLSLRGNPLVAIHKHAFRDLSGVDFLYLPFGIERIEPDAFNGLSNVSVFQLENLKLNYLQRWTFRGLVGVKDLAIRDSKVDIFDDGVFANTTDVKSIVIEDCNVTTILAGAFSGMKNVSELRIVGNRITNFHPGALDEETLEEVAEVKVQNNMVPCDCRVRWIRKQAVLIPSIVGDTICSSPEKRRDDRVSSVFPGDVTDDCDPYTIPLPAGSPCKVASLVLHIVLVIIVSLFIR